MNMLDFSRNHFDLFGLPAQFRVDTAALDAAYRRLQGEVHPDRHASGTDADRRLALQASARVNEAYQALREPITRAEYLLSLHGIDARDESDTQLPIDFLERQLERREQASDAVDAHDAPGLRAVIDAVRGEARELEDRLHGCLDDRRAYAEARGPVRELRFLHKIGEDLRALEATLDETVTD
jgi:molecular chaperone HscB